MGHTSFFALLLIFGWNLDNLDYTCSAIDSDIFLIFKNLIGFKLRNLCPSGEIATADGSAVFILFLSFGGASLVTQWLRLCAPNVGGKGSIPDWGTKIPHATEHDAQKKHCYFHLFYSGSPEGIPAWLSGHRGCAQTPQAQIVSAHCSGSACGLRTLKGQSHDGLRLFFLPGFLGSLPSEGPSMASSVPGTPH